MYVLLDIFLHRVFVPNILSFSSLDVNIGHKISVTNGPSIHSN